MQSVRAVISQVMDEFERTGDDSSFYRLLGMLDVAYLAGAITLYDVARYHDRIMDVIRLFELKKLKVYLPTGE